MRSNPETRHYSPREEKIPVSQDQDMRHLQTVEEKIPVATGTDKILVDSEGADLFAITGRDQQEHWEYCHTIPPTRCPNHHRHQQFHQFAASHSHHELDRSHNHLHASRETSHQSFTNNYNYHCTHTHTHTYANAPPVSAACTPLPTAASDDASYGPIGMTLHVTSVAIGAPFTLTRLGFSVVAQKITKGKEAFKARNNRVAEAGS